MDQEDLKRLKRIESYLLEELSDGESDNGNTGSEQTYFSGLEDSDDTDDDPDYHPDSDISDEEGLQLPVEGMDVEDNAVEETIERVIETYCRELSSTTHIPQQPASVVQPPLPPPVLGFQPPSPTSAATVQSSVPSPPPATVVQPPLLPQDATHPNHIVCTTRRMKGKDGHLWTNTPAQASTCSAARNVVHIRQGPLGCALDKTTPLETFALFFTEEMQRKQQNYSQIKATVSEMSSEEFDAFLGVLILSASQKDNHMASEELFNSEFCGDRYKATMSCARFDFLVEALRFDLRETRESRCKEDRFAPVREVWDQFITACKEHYKPGSYVTIDEQLLAFRGRCKFRMYIPNKPSKYGMKIVMLCDTGTKYMFNALPYLGKNTTPRNVPQAQYLVKELTRPLYGTNRNITCDNWFTSVPLATDLLAAPINLTLVGTLRRDKPEIPPEMKDPGTRPIGSSMFCFDGHKTMVSYKPKNKKVVLLLSTTHDQPSINADSKKPEIIESYNSTKGAVDTLDQISTSRKTRRWPLCVLYGMVNIMLVNSYVIYVHNKISRGETPVSRRNFTKELHCQLVKPWMEHRLQLPTMSRSIRQAIASILHLDLPAAPQGNQQPQGRKICGYCPSKKRV